MMKRQKKKNIDVKEQLLCCALELFTRKGYTATSVRDIVSLAGVTKPALYYHFKNKEEIYLNLVGRFFAKIESLFVDVARAQLSIKDQLFDLCDRVLLLFAENKDLARLINLLRPAPGSSFFRFQVVSHQYPSAYT
jgi:AcrR family transcriptional regulator